MKNSSYNKIISNANKSCRTFSLTMGYGCLVAGIFYTAKPFVYDKIVYLMDEVLPLHELPFKAEYFFDVKFSPGYEIIYFIQIWLTYFMVIFTVSCNEKLQ